MKLFQFHQTSITQKKKLMNIIQNNKESLTIIDKPCKLSFLLFITTITSLYFFIVNFSVLNQEQCIAFSSTILLLSFSTYATRKKFYMDFDTTTQTVGWYREELFRTHKGTFKFSDIKDVMRKEVTGSDDKSYNISVRLKNGTKIKITMYESTIEEYEAIRDTIMDYLEKYTTKSERSCNSHYYKLGI